MDKLGYIEIKVSGFVGNLELTPDHYDIRDVVSILEHAENLLVPGDKKSRPMISYKIEEGSVRHIFKTSVQYIIAFNAIISQVAQNQNIDFLEYNSAKAFENLQETAIKKNYTITILTSLENSSEITIDRNTRYYRTEAFWADAEFYFYGKVTNAGGKDKANIHIVTDELGTVIIKTPISFLEKYDENLLYKTFGIRATGKQHSETGQIDTSSLSFVELIDYQRNYDEEYLKGLREKAKKAWLEKTNPDEWLREIRGGYDE